MNVVILSGYLTKDYPELRTTGSGKSVCSFSIGVNTGWGENKQTYFPNLIAWNQQAEWISKQPKGTPVQITGWISERKWTDKDGNERRTVEITCNTVETMGRRASDAEQPPQQEPRPENRALYQPRNLTPNLDRNGQPIQPAQQQTITPNYTVYSNDDDLPF